MSVDVPRSAAQVERLAALSRYDASGAFAIWNRPPNRHRVGRRGSLWSRDGELMEGAAAMVPRKAGDAGRSGVPPAVVEHRGHAVDIAPSFFEVQAWLSPCPGGDNAYDLHATVRVNAAEISHGDAMVEVRALQATLVFAIDGLVEDLRKPRFGDLQLEAEHWTEVTTDVMTEGKVSARAGAKGTLTPVGALASVTGEASAQGQKSFRTVEKGKAESVARRVIARPSCRWEFREPDGSTLNGTYLLGTKLCTLRRKEGANRIGIVGRLHVRQRDLRFHHDDDGWFERLKRNKQRLFDLFLTKILDDDHNHRGPGVIFLSTVEIEL